MDTTLVINILITIVFFALCALIITILFMFAVAYFEQMQKYTLARYAEYIAKITLILGITTAVSGAVFMIYIFGLHCWSLWF